MISQERFEMDDRSASLYALIEFARQNQFSKFILVGMLNTLFGYSMFAAFIYCGLHYVLACFLATCIGVVFNFLTMGKLVFRQDSSHLFWRFVAIYAFVYCVNVSLLKLGTFFFQNIYINGAMGAPIIAMISYTLNKYIVFGRMQDEAH